jgi:hypothetical protein
MPATDGTSTSPIVVDFGKHKAKLVKQLCNGKGKLVDQVSQTLDELRTAGTISTSAQPVIIVVRERRRRKSVLSMLKV